MIKRFLIERRSWILLVLFIQSLFLFIAWIDPAIPIASIAYIVFLSLIIVIVFLVIRFYKETSFYRTLEDSDHSVYQLDKEVKRPFEKIVYEHFRTQENEYALEKRENQYYLEQEKDELMAWIHEVKTPLTTIKLMVDRVDNRMLKQQLMVEWLRIDLLLDQQLHQKRIPFIENDYSIQKLNLESLINKEIKHLMSWCIQKGIGFDLSIQAKDVYSDETWLRFIIRQVVTNAVKYSDDGDITITSKLKNDQLQLTIQDAGKGIAAKDIPRIFDKGFTSTLETRDQAATGMGLYLVKKVAEHLRITIDVQSVLHEGTTVKIIFPKKNEVVGMMSM